MRGRGRQRDMIRYYVVDVHVYKMKDERWVSV